jgi:hypothetical protein
MYNLIDQIDQIIGKFRHIGIGRYLSRKQTSS